MSANAKKAPGRPVGSRTADRDLVDTTVSRCKRCDSTERTQYHEVKVIEGSGVDPNGRPYTSVELRPTQCCNPECGQHRIDRSWKYSTE